MPMKPSRIVLSSSSPNGPYLSYHSTRCPKLPGKLVLLYFAGADRHAASTVACPRLPGTALLTASLFVVLLVASTLWTGAHPAEAGSTARFEPGTCPITPEPIPALQTAQCDSHTRCSACHDDGVYLVPYWEASQIADLAKRSGKYDAQKIGTH